MMKKGHREEARRPERGDVAEGHRDPILRDINEVELQSSNLRKFKADPFTVEAVIAWIADDVAAPPQHRFQVGVDPDARRFPEVAKDYFSRHSSRAVKSFT